MDCECSYYSPGFLKAGGCIVTKAPPKNYKCKCEYTFLWTCTGTPWKCENKVDYRDLNKEYCTGCKDNIKCCIGKAFGGDCSGYWYL